MAMPARSTCSSRRRNTTSPSAAADHRRDAIRCSMATSLACRGRPASLAVNSTACATPSVSGAPAFIPAAWSRRSPAVPAPVPGEYRRRGVRCFGCAPTSRIPRTRPATSVSAASLARAAGCLASSPSSVVRCSTRTPPSAPSSIATTSTLGSSSVVEVWALLAPRGGPAHGLEHPYPHVTKQVLNQFLRARHFSHLIQVVLIGFVVLLTREPSDRLLLVYAPCLPRVPHPAQPFGPPLQPPRAGRHGSI